MAHDQSRFKPAALFCLGLMCACLSVSARGDLLRNGNFAEAQAGGAKDWQLFGDPATSHLARHGADRSERARATLSLRHQGAGLASMGQSLDATSLRGRLVELHGRLKVSGPESHSAALWLGPVDETNVSLGVENMSANRITGETPWREFSIRLYVPAGTSRLTAGVLLIGTGTVEIGSLNLTPIESTIDASKVPLSPVLAQILGLIQQHSLRYDAHAQAAINGVLRAHAGVDAQAPAAAFTIAKQMFGALGDRHSHFPVLAVPSENTNATQEVARPAANPLKPTLALDAKGRAVLALPRTPSGDAAGTLAFSREGGRLLLPHSSDCGVVIDLRKDSGGNMWPMLSALGPILPDGTLGYFVSREQVSTPWHLPSASLRAKDKSGPDHIAVLIGPNTASSGEAVALVLASLPKARLFGQATAGYATSNQMFTLLDGSVLALETAHMARANGGVQQGPIQPDVAVDEAHSLSAATDWIEQSCKR